MACLVPDVLCEEGADGDPEEAGEGHHYPKLVADGLQSDLIAPGHAATRSPRSYQWGKYQSVNNKEKRQQGFVLKNDNDS